jgi:hypothetical protein
LLVSHCPIYFVVVSCSQINHYMLQRRERQWAKLSSCFVIVPKTKHCTSITLRHEARHLTTCAPIHLDKLINRNRRMQIMPHCNIIEHHATTTKLLFPLCPNGIRRAVQ